MRRLDLWLPLPLTLGLVLGSLACNDECGRCSGSGIADDALGFFIEGCTPEGRGSEWSGGIRLSLDHPGQTMTVTPPFPDTSASPASCFCQ